MTEQEVTTTLHQAPLSDSLPPIGQLFQESWILFKKNALHLFIFSIIAVLGFVLITIIAFLIAGIFGLANIFPSFVGKGEFSPLINPTLIMGITIALIAWVIGLTIVGAISQIGPVLMIASHKELPYSDVLKKSFSLIIPYYWVSFLVGLTVFGGFFMFVIPAILFSLFFLFAGFEVVLGEKKGIEAMKSSYLMVKSRFGDILGRWALIIGIGFLTNIFTNVLTGMADDRASEMMTVVFVSYLLNLLVSWFSICYMIALYKQVKAIHVEKTPVSLLWVWVVTIIGWTIPFLLFTFATFLITQLASDKEFQRDLQKFFNSEKMKQMEKQYDNRYNYGPSGGERFQPTLPPRQRMTY